MARRASTQPTDGELEILGVLWDEGPATLGRICAALRTKRPVATTTVATMLKVMADKGFARRRRGPRGYLWSAAISRKATTTGLLRKLLDRVFDGSAHQLVAHLLEEGELSEGDRREIRKLLERVDAGERRVQGGVRQGL